MCSRITSLFVLTNFEVKYLPNKLDTKTNIQVEGILKLKIRKPGGGGVGTPYNGLHGEAPPERGTFFRLQVYVKGVPFSIKGI